MKKTQSVAPLMHECAGLKVSPLCIHCGSPSVSKALGPIGKVIWWRGTRIEGGRRDRQADDEIVAAYFCDTRASGCYSRSRGETIVVTEDCVSHGKHPRADDAGTIRVGTFGDRAEMPRPGTATTRPGAILQTLEASRRRRRCVPDHDWYFRHGFVHLNMQIDARNAIRVYNGYGVDGVEGCNHSSDGKCGNGKRISSIGVHPRLVGMLSISKRTSASRDNARAHVIDFDIKVFVPEAGRHGRVQRGKIQIYHSIAVEIDAKFFPVIEQAVSIGVLMRAAKYHLRVRAGGYPEGNFVVAGNRDAGKTDFVDGCRGDGIKDGDGGYGRGGAQLVANLKNGHWLVNLGHDGTADQLEIYLHRPQPGIRREQIQRARHVRRRYKGDHYGVAVQPRGAEIRMNDADALLPLRAGSGELRWVEGLEIDGHGRARGGRWVVLNFSNCRASLTGVAVTVPIRAGWGGKCVHVFYAFGA